LKSAGLTVFELLAFNAQKFRGHVTLATPPFRKIFKGLQLFNVACQHERGQRSQETTRGTGLQQYDGWGGQGRPRTNILSSHEKTTEALLQKNLPPSPRAMLMERFRFVYEVSGPKIKSGACGLHLDVG